MPVLRSFATTNNSWYLLDTPRENRRSLHAGFCGWSKPYWLRKLLVKTKAVALIAIAQIKSSRRSSSMCYHAADKSSSCTRNGYCEPFFCQNPYRVWENCLHMNDERYPRLTFRLSGPMRSRVVRAARQRHVSHGQIVREALTAYLIGRVALDNSSHSDSC